ncbi:MAG: glutamate formimidoyltransferase [Gemmatimonadaceae bacterium]|nr:glutamate formimidoyltransferase [Gemmatimonadaceae bacterium]
MKLIECVPNFSEGRRPEVVAAIRDAIAAVEGVSILDSSSDASHNRSVITFVAPAERVVEAAFAGIREAATRIDLREHTGEHPRIGATDVVPFVPLDGSTMDDCIAFARQLGERVAKELAIPVYLYERAATRPGRVNLAEIRRGQFEGLRDELGTNPERDPDFGPKAIHQSAGATAIGARPFLVAYNVYLGPASNLPLAKSIAKAVRGSSGGFKAVKGLGMEVDGQAQVSMNLVDTDETPIHVVYDTIAEKARAEGVEVTWSEIIGLVPERVLLEASKHYLKLAQYTPDQVLERQVSRAMRASGVTASSEVTLGATPTAASSTNDFLAAVASSDPVPGGGSVAAYAGALAASLIRMVAGLTIGRKKYVAVEAEMAVVAANAERLAKSLRELVDRDAAAYAAVSAAYKMPKDTSDAVAARDHAITDALFGAAEVPLDTARLCAESAELAAVVATKGNSNAMTDAGLAALLAEAGAKGAAYNVLVNVNSLADRSRGVRLAKKADALVTRAAAAASEATNAVDRALEI